LPYDLADMRPKLYPRDWVSRRWHSLLGLWLVIYIIWHLLVNSQAALFVGSDGAGFIKAVNGLHNLPYLPVIEVVVLGIPFFLHGLWGVQYALTAKFNSSPSDGRKPALARYPRNHAFTWQRITSWVILVGVILHVIQMRFIDYPYSLVVGGDQRLLIINVPFDPGLYTLASRLNVALLNRAQIEQLNGELLLRETLLGPPEQLAERLSAQELNRYDPQLAEQLGTLQKFALDRSFVEGLVAMMPREHQVAAITDEFGKALLLMVRATFRNPWMILLYTIFVLAAVYHGFRGLWSFMIVWGFTLTARSQRYMSTLAIWAMVVVGFLGLSAVWLTYWVNLRT
jgi:succinate dehydrogenase / fumarate reductase, cytochrome b subunit